jgi:hypothetical protein
MRLLRASEWEYVAREGGTQSWICAPSGDPRDIKLSLEALSQHPQFSPGKDVDLATNGFGVWALHVGEWVLEQEDIWPTEPNASRGGPQLWPFQEPAEIAWAHPAVHRRGRTFHSPNGVRLALDVVVA